jgi:hypothetical protein
MATVCLTRIGACAKKKPNQQTKKKKKTTNDDITVEIHHSMKN